MRLLYECYILWRGCGNCKGVNITQVLHYCKALAISTSLHPLPGLRAWGAPGFELPLLFTVAGFEGSVSMSLSLRHIEC